ncbi:MAG: carbohydrate ABC transporter permease, partial [Acidimicrobiaceae bacterium]|nr:carbohydrate ABC transporter permease [Acidimicrobiaceae bacterium]
DIDSSGWWTAWNDLDNLTFQNYRDIFRESAAQPSMWEFAFNSVAIVVPATIIPIAVAAFAAYGFAWMDFRGRNWLFIGLVSMIALPNQMAFVPLLQLFNGGARFTIPGVDWTLALLPDVGIANTAAAVWLTHTAFGLPLAVLLLHNFVSQLPRDIFEAARIDGASHFTIFCRLVVPLARPALAAFAVFQFLWTWNDYLIASVFLNENEPMTIALVNLVGERGQNFQLRFASAFVIMVVPLIVFFSLQRHFVRGLLAGSVKG